MANLLTRIIDPVFMDRDRVASQYRFAGDWRSWAVPAGIGGALLLVSLLGLAIDPLRFMYAYHTGWTFCLSISLGALIFVMLQHITRAKWVTTVRRVPELLMTNFVLLAVLAIPIVIDVLFTHQLFHWTHKELYDPASPTYDRILVGKRAYLNEPFFLARLAFYFFCWIFVSSKLYRLSVYQDTDPRPETGMALRRVSAWGIPLIGITMAFAGFDLLKSLDPHWFSTIFGVYFFAGGFQAALAAIIVVTLVFKRSGMLENEVTREHLHDLGKYLFGFTVFWTYIAFSQYMLYWYGNLPEETIWYHHRFQHGWQYLTYSLIWLKFVVPFVVLMPRFVKRTPQLMAFMSIWILVMHWVDLFWVAMPNYDLGGHAAFSWIDIAAWLGLAGLFFGATFWRASRGYRS